MFEEQRQCAGNTDIHTRGNANSNEYRLVSTTSWTTHGDVAGWLGGLGVVPECYTVCLLVPCNAQGCERFLKLEPARMFTRYSTMLHNEFTSWRERWYSTVDRAPFFYHLNATTRCWYRAKRRFNIHLHIFSHVPTYENRTVFNELVIFSTVCYYFVPCSCSRSVA